MSNKDHDVNGILDHSAVKGENGASEEFLVDKENTNILGNNDNNRTVTTEKRNPSGAAKETHEQEESYSDVLSKTHGTIVDCLQPSGQLLNFLCQHSVLNQDMVAKVQCRPSRTERAKELVGFLQNLGPKSFQSFIAALRFTEQIYLANVLDSHAIIY